MPTPYHKRKGRLCACPCVYGVPVYTYLPKKENTNSIAEKPPSAVPRERVNAAATLSRVRTVALRRGEMARPTVYLFIIISRK